MSKTTTEMKLIETSKLIPYVNNARTHGETIPFADLEKVVSPSEV